MNRFWVHCNSIKSCKHQIEMFKMSEDFNQFGGAQSNALQRNFKNSSQKKNRPDEHSFAARYKSTERLLDCNIHIVVAFQFSLATNQMNFGKWTGRSTWKLNFMRYHSKRCASNFAPKQWIHTRIHRAQASAHICARTLNRTTDWTVNTSTSQCAYSMRHIGAMVSLIVLIVINSPRFISIYQFK